MKIGMNDTLDYIVMLTNLDTYGPFGNGSGGKNVSMFTRCGQIHHFSGGMSIQTKLRHLPCMARVALKTVPNVEHVISWMILYLVTTKSIMRYEHRSSKNHLKGVKVQVFNGWQLNLINTSWMPKHHNCERSVTIYLRGTSNMNWKHPNGDR